MRYFEVLKIFWGILVLATIVFGTPKISPAIYESDGKVSLQLNSAGYNDEMVGLIVTAPSGKRGGFEFKGAARINEFPEGVAAFSRSYAPCGGEEDDVCNNPAPQGVESVMRLEEVGVYTITLYGNDSTDAHFGMFVNDHINQKTFSYGADTMLDKGVTATFKFNYNPNSDTPFTVIRIATVGDLKKDIKLTYETGQEYAKNNVEREYWQFYIDNEGIMKSLLKKAEASEDAANRGQYKTAINKLKALINEVKAQTGKHLDERAATILTEDAEYIIKELEAK